MRRYEIAIDGRTFTIDIAETASDAFDVSVDGRRFAATLTGDHDLPGVAISPVLPARATTDAAARPDAIVTESRPAPTGAPRPAAHAARSVLAAPMPGAIIEVVVTPGAIVRRGDTLLVLEAMKMRNAIRAPRDATVTEVAVAAGDHVSAGDPLVRFGPPPG